ncbi:DUF4034 domain-containing protein [Actinoplanes hulinensis]|uniref:DUF4034 domain-containing protein n=1 Tax=Actinoplanes hulinensis TaxID=1144547 RepID=A0ABS7B8R2_9ACTN|nr:DUF4034 domain-containing protein [Actinoplanes hulinensis]MBW6437459.1 DUF4034 domain-containing protein [Actinoplanes hulinensis]
MWPFRRKPALAVDPTCGVPRARALAAALTARDRDTVRDIFDAATDPDQRALLMETAVTVDGVQDWIGAWVHAEPDSTLPLLIRGCHAVEWAWQARGRRAAAYTGRESFEEFFRRLRRAETWLQEVTARDPADVTALTWMITTARGLQLDPAEATARFDRVVALHPYHLIAHEQRLQGLCGKWSGDDERMLAFARKTVAGAPDGGLLPALVAIAHFETGIGTWGEECLAYMRSAEVRKDLLAAADRSIFHPGFQRGPGWARRVAVFAMTLEVADELDASGRAHDLLGDHVTEFPWGYLGDPVEGFRQSRDFVRQNRP